MSWNADMTLEQELEVLLDGRDHLISNLDECAGTVLYAPLRADLDFNFHDIISVMRDLECVL